MGAADVEEVMLVVLVEARYGAELSTKMGLVYTTMAGIIRTPLSRLRKKTYLASILSTTPSSMGDDITLRYCPLLKGFVKTSRIPLKKLVAISLTAKPTAKPVIPIPVIRGLVSTPSVPSTVIPSIEYRVPVAALAKNLARSSSLVRPLRNRKSSIGAEIENPACCLW